MLRSAHDISALSRIATKFPARRDSKARRGDEAQKPFQPPDELLREPAVL
jgi:hypothetical protein